MSNFTQDNINFTVENYTPTPVVNRVSTATQAALLKGKATKSVNAVEIDWNGAELA